MEKHTMRWLIGITSVILLGVILFVFMRNYGFGEGQRQGGSSAFPGAPGNFCPECK